VGTLLCFVLLVKTTWPVKLIREDASSFRLKITHSSVSISLKQDGLHCQESRASAMATQQPKGSAHVSGFVRAPTFWRRSNCTKSNQLRRAPVPNLYLFGTFSTKNRP
jgi:hypothetical protein